MSGSQASELTNSGVSASGEVDTLLIEKFNGKVNEQYLKGENLQVYFEVQTVQGTNTVSNKYMGDTQLQVLAPGQEAEATPTEYDKNALTVDTSVIARNTVAHLHDVQNDINGNKSKIAANQVLKLKKLEDEMLIQQMIFGVINNTEAQRTTPRVSGHGFSIRVDVSDAQADDPNSLLSAIEFAMEQQLEQEVDVDMVTVFMPWKYFNVLRDAERIVSKDYTTVTDTPISGYMLKSYGVPVVPTNRFPTYSNEANNDHNILSSNSNGYRYDTTDEMLTCVAIAFTSDALLVGRTIEVQGDIFWDKKTKSYFIDSWMAEGAIPDRWEAASAVFRAAASDNAEITARANRKAKVIKDISA